MPAKLFKTKIIDVSNLIIQKIEKHLTLVIVSTLEEIHYFWVKKAGIRYIGKLERPQIIEKGWLPVLACMQPKNKEFYYSLIFWKNLALLVKVHGPNIILVGEKSFDRNLLWGTVIFNKVVFMVDYEYNIFIETLESLYISKKDQDGKYINFYGGCMFLLHLGSSGALLKTKNL